LDAQGGADERALRGSLWNAEVAAHVSRAILPK
jgi:hypothetical protein